MAPAPTRPADFFDDKYGMDSTSLQRILGKTLSPQVDYADLYFQYEVSDAVSLEEGQVKQASKHVNQGVGARAIERLREKMLAAVEQAKADARDLQLGYAG